MLAAYREGSRRQPNNVQVYSTLLLTLNYIADVDPADVFTEYQGWGRVHMKPAGWVGIHDNSREVERRLRVGYVSPDFRAHSVAYYIEPLLAAHQRQEVEVFCYSVTPKPDATTERLRLLVDHWRDIHGWRDARLVEKIRADRPDRW